MLLANTTKPPTSGQLPPLDRNMNRTLLLLTSSCKPPYSHTMYMPGFMTLWRGLRAWPHLSSVRFEWGIVAWDLQHDKRDDKRMVRLGVGDVLVWIGHCGHRIQPWRALRRRGVRVVYYQTEPLTSPSCQLGRREADEI